MIAGLAWGGGIIAVALGATFARKLGYIDGDTETRVFNGMMGLIIIWNGNRMPKAFFPIALARKVSWVGGWSMVMSGLVYVGLWAFAPMPVAATAGCAAVVAGIVVPVGYCVWFGAKAKAV
ncbi:MAG: ammonium transporter [Pirellula sp.]|nr:ammonium transporter [Pirellula sp.]